MQMEKKVVDLLQPLSILLIIPLLFLLVLSRSRRKRYPPGPKGWPVIGNMGLMGQLSHRGLAELAQQYGGVVHLRMGLLHMVAISSPAAAREVLQLHDHVFSNRPANRAITYLTYDRADMAFADYGPFWRQMRKLCVVKLFSRRRAESWDSVRDEVGRMVRAVGDRSGGGAVNVGELVFGLTRSIVYRAAFGSGSHEGQDEFVSILQEFSKLFGAFNIADFVPWLNCMDLQGLNARLAKARDSLDGFIDSIIDQHIQNMKKLNVESVDTDMVDELLAFYSEEANISEKEDLHNSIKLTRNNIKAIIMDVMFGGTETVASAVEWAMTELLRSPQDLAKVQEELKSVAGLARKVEEPDLEKLTYLRCCLKEVLRLHPPIPLLLHEASADATVCGYHVPKGSRVMINAWAIGRDPGAWPDAEEFKPARFLDGAAPDFRGAHFEFVPFGSGRRSCPGMQLGLHALEMAVAQLLHCYTWRLPDGVRPEDLDMSDVFGLTAPRATRLVAVPAPRLLCPL